MIIPNEHLRLVLRPISCVISFGLPISDDLSQFFEVEEPNPEAYLIYCNGKWYQVSKTKVVVGEHKERKDNSVYCDETVKVKDYDSTYIIHELGTHAPKEVEQNDRSIFLNFDFSDFTHLLVSEGKLLALKKILSRWKTLDKDEMARISKIATDSQVTLVPSAQGESWCPKIKTTSGSGAIQTLYDWSELASQILVALATNCNVLGDTATDSETAQE